ncbi:hypothetical protein K443DRAFT_123962 [Laccaria amethystina LaAM-08-1]|uniref:Neprosin PEP catalytic domain-containing protein n=1 Tax=Laccaria amethystina LaAM-08-1 TaxID=1095629 RepID=A0A0C9XJF6_9AGAR|nr:hypothetical protein K443DRAFT_123962 [Laccaria amethystina LaAM-08-1]
MLTNSPIFFLGLFALALQAIPRVASAPVQVPFGQFLATVRAANFQQWRHSAVDSEASFNQMKAHVLDIYSGVGTVKHSFLHDGRYADCIDIHRQPSLAGRPLATAPIAPLNQPPATSGGPTGPTAPIDSPLTQNLKDPFGNDISCPDGTIPFARLTLERLTAFPTLAGFFAKSTTGAGRAPHATRELEGELEGRGPAAQPHLYAYGFQQVTNYGGHSWLNLWNPIGDFSLSQQWYVGGSGANLQTAEGGWVVYPQHFSTKAVLFIFFTPDDYTTGCYNLECKAFVQISNKWFLGGTFDQYSVTGDGQRGFDLQWKLFGVNWWLFLRGPGATYDAVGYYPGSVYKGGQLTRNASLIEYGGEVTRFTTADVWPQMGSGMFPSKGYSQAAFQNTIYYNPRNEDDGVGVWSFLTKVVVGSTNCWDINITESAQGGGWGTFFFYGGPGGNTC